MLFCCEFFQFEWIKQKAYHIFIFGKIISCCISIFTRFKMKQWLEILLNDLYSQIIQFMEFERNKIYQRFYIKYRVEMSQSNTVSLKKYQSLSKTVFLIERKQTKLMCGICPIFDQDQAEVFHKQTKLWKKNEAKYAQRQNINPTKQNKKSLKSNVRIRKNYVDKADSVQPKPIEQNYQYHKIQTSTKINSQSRIKTFDAKKTEFSDRDLTIYQRPSVSFLQTLNLKQVAHYSSCTNLNVNLIKSSYENNPKTRIERFSYVPIVQSINNENNSAMKDFYKMYPIRQLVRVASEHHNLKLIKFKSNLTHKSSNISISPVMPVANPEEKEVSNFIYYNRNDSNQNTINKLIQLASSPVLKENGFECQFSDTVKTAFKARENQFIQQNITEPVIPEQHNMTARHQYQQDHSFKSKQSNHFLQISINQHEPFINIKRSVSKIQNSPPQSIERQKLQQSFDKQSVIQIRVSTQKMHSSQTEYDINQPQQIGTQQETPVTISKKSKNFLIRYSVQVPTSKKFSKFKVRRTISMKDKQDSSEDQTSQVIYGFRKSHNLEVVEDIAEDMHESYITRGDIRIDPSEMHDFHNL